MMTGELSDVDKQIVDIFKEKRDGYKRSEIVYKLYGVGNVFQLDSDGIFERDRTHKDVEKKLDDLVTSGVLSKIPKSDAADPSYCIRL